MDKKVTNKELKNVSGGLFYNDELVNCPKCENKFDGYLHVVEHGSGCNKKTYWKCPKCGYEWK